MKPSSGRVPLSSGMPRAIRSRGLRWRSTRRRTDLELLTGLYSSPRISGVLALALALPLGGLTGLYSSPLISGSSVIQKFLQDQAYFSPRNFVLIGGEHNG